MGTGFVLAQLPMRYTVGALGRLLLFVLRPVAMIYAAAKLIEEIRRGDVDERREQPAERREEPQSIIVRP